MTATTATARLQAALGDPDQVVRGSKGAKSEIWLIDDPRALEELAQISAAPADAPSPRPDADNPKPVRAIIDARLSSRELQGGETIGGQIYDCLHLAKSQGLQVNAILACTNFRSELEFDEREDMRFVLEQIEAGLSDAVVIREPDRIARHTHVAQRFIHELGLAGADLYLGSLGRRYEPDSDGDQLIVGVEGVVSQVDAKKGARRMRRQLERVWLEEGRGWPGCKRFGFRRNPQTKFLEADPEQWWIVKFIHENYAEAEKKAKGRRSGCQALSERLSDMGIDLSGEKIRRILQDPIYVDGRYSVKHGDERVAAEPIALKDPIPRRLFQKNQEQLASRKGANTVNPVGTFCLNGIKVWHAACRDTKCWDGLPPRLKAHARSGRGPGYYHNGRAPRECRGYRIEQLALESVVIAALLKLADDPELQKAWASAARVESEPQTPILGEAEIRELEAELANLERERERQTRELVAQARTGTPVTTSQRGLLDAIEEEVTRVTERLDAARASRAREVSEETALRDSSTDELRAALHEILTAKVPRDADLRVRRQAVIECCLSAVVVHDLPDDQFEVELVGPLAPMEAVTKGRRLPISPIDASRHILEAHIQAQEEDQTAVEGTGDDQESDAGSSSPKGNTSTLGTPYVEVSRLAKLADSPEHRRRKRRQIRLRNQWPGRFRGLRGKRTPVWRSPRLPAGDLDSSPAYRHCLKDCEAALLAAAAELPALRRAGRLAG